jgi:O-antigen/teichoic acid export membrane protein
VPRYGYLGAAWGHLSCYLFMVLLSYFQGQKHFPISYDLKNISIYFLLAISLFGISYFIKIENLVLRLLVNSLLLAVFSGFVFINEKYHLTRLVKR